MPVTKDVNLNRSQAIIDLVNPNVMHMMAPRANGKTSIIGDRLMKLNKKMPRCQVVLYSDTFERLTTITFPAIQAFLSDQLGLIENVDYVVFKRPPEYFTKPFIIPRKFDKVISFKDGLSVVLGCSFKDGSVNGISAQAALIDETKFVREDRIKSQLFRALRGNFKRYGHLPEYRSVWTFTDKYQGDVRWIIKLREQQDINVINAVMLMQLHVHKLDKEKKKAAAENNRTAYYRLKNEIVTLEQKLNTLRKEMVFVCDAKPFENIDALGEKFYRDQKRDCKSIHEYNIAVLNYDPNKVEHTFYPDLTDRRLYKHIPDVDTKKSLAIALDYQWRINPLVVGQWGKIMDDGTRTFNIVSSMHVLYPAGLKDVVKLFCNTYLQHPYKVVDYVYDKTAIGRDPARDSFKKIVIDELYANGWGVNEVYIGEPPEHDIKYEEIRMMLQADGDGSIMINELTNEYLLKSLYQAGTRTGQSGKTMKDKRDEKNDNFPAEESTDYTDAFDQLLWAGIKLGLLQDYNVGTGAILKAN
jgi:hypothetical protein